MQSLTRTACCAPVYHPQSQASCESHNRFFQSPAHGPDEIETPSQGKLGTGPQFWRPLPMLSSCLSPMGCACSGHSRVDVCLALLTGREKPPRQPGRLKEHVAGASGPGDNPYSRMPSTAPMVWSSVLSEFWVCRKWKSGIRIPRDEVYKGAPSVNPNSCANSAPLSF